MVSVRWMGTGLLSLSLAACTSVMPEQQAAQPAPEPHILTQYQWQRAAPESGPHRYPVTLQFAKGRITATQLCNHLSGSYQVDGAQLEVGQMVSTMKMCADASLMQWEQFVARHLPTVQDYVVAMRPDSDSPLLTLTFKEGENWVLQGQATAETRYGGPAERVFWEIAPEKAQCTHPLMKQGSCLKVREVHYNDSGIKTSTGEWENFYGTIEGHAFKAGQRQVLRLKRFTRKNVAADQSRYVYVLDMVVETETVKP